MPEIDIDESSLSKMLAPLGEDDLDEVIKLMFEDLDSFRSRLAAVTEPGGPEYRKILHKVLGFAKQFHLSAVAFSARSGLAWSRADAAMAISLVDADINRTTECLTGFIARLRESRRELARAG